jgi:hypothetical protein
MSRTRADLDDKLTRLQARMHELKPQQLSRRYVPDYFLDRALGGLLTMIGLKMAWSRFRGQRHPHRDRVRAHLAAYGHW